MNNPNVFDKEQQLLDLKLLLSQATYPAEREVYFIEYSNLKFEKNLKAFHQFFPEIYQKYLTYQPAEKFHLFPNPNGSANIIDYDAKLPMYSDDPVLQCEQQVADNIKKPIIGRTDHSSVNKIENTADFRHIDLMCSIGDIYNQAKDSLASFNQLGTSIPSVMVFGIGLGYHLTGIVAATRAGFVSFFEPNEDYFFASLFVSDWAEILQTLDANGSYLYLGIGLSETEIYEQFYSRTRQISVASICHAWFYQHYPSIDVNKWIDEFKTNYHQFFAGFGFFDDALIGIAHTLQNLENGMPLLTKHNIDDPVVSKIPVFIIANGPSLDSDIDYIKTVKHKVIIFSCNSATTALIKHGIIPDFHVALERTVSTYNFLHDKVPAEFRSKINLLTLNVMHPMVGPLFPWVGAALKPGEAATQIIQLSQYRNKNKVINTISYCNPLVGNTALSFACHMGFKNIYMFGVDNGYVDAEHHHAKSSYYYNEKGQSLYKPFKVGNDFKVPGNFADYVLTEQFMYVGNVQMGRLLNSFKSHRINCYNCSNGVKVEHTIPLHSSDVILENISDTEKQNIINHIKTSKFENTVTRQEIESYLEFDNFDLFCQTLVSILSKEINTRHEALSALLESIRYLYSFKNSAPYLSLYLIIEGETLYVTTILISLLYNFGDDDEIIFFYKQALQAWIDFLIAAPEYYRNNYDVAR